MSVLPSYMYVTDRSACFVSIDIRRGVESQDGAGVTDGCKLPHEYWELNLGSLKEQQMFLNPELSHQPLD